MPSIDMSYVAATLYFLGIYFHYIHVETIFSLLDREDDMNKRLLFWIACLGFAGALAFVAGAQLPASNYHEQGGARWVIGGTADVESGGEIEVESG